MPRFYVPNPRIEKELLKVEGSEARHIRRVLRLKVGDRLVLFDGFAKEYEGIIVQESPTSVMMKVENISSPAKESPLEITLAQSLLKGEKMEYLIQKATELGIKKIIPFFSSRSVPLLDKSKKLRRYHRWEKIAIEACKQCGRIAVPKVEPLQIYSEMLGMAQSEALRLILWEKKGQGLKETLKGSKGRTEIFFVVGPEGGMSDEEVGEAEKAGFMPITLGKRILRSETAGLCLLSVLQYEWGDLG
jgi:16S rRNA (uracil1498-N3)-methyltransferase